MTLAEACELVAQLTSEVSAARAERDAFRMLARGAIQYAHDLRLEINRLRDRYHQVIEDRRQERRPAA